jgi:hypothetical protein
MFASDELTLRVGIECWIRVARADNPPVAIDDAAPAARCRDTGRCSDRRPPGCVIRQLSKRQQHHAFTRRHAQSSKLRIVIGDYNATENFADRRIEHGELGCGGHAEKG